MNGEIYNHKQLRKDMVAENPEVDGWFRTASDCECIVHLYDLYGTKAAAMLDGDFAFVLLDEATGEVYAARDPIGVNSLYMGTGLDGAKWFASEAKPLVQAGCIDVETFPPGHYYTNANGRDELVEYYTPKWRDVAASTTPLDLKLIRDTFTQAVEKRLMSDVPFGVLLSGGLDSSLVASVIARLRRQRFLQTGDPSDLEPLKSFSIGLEGSPDLIAAQKVADAIGTEHYGFTFTVQEGIDAVSDVIYHLETYDITTIRAGTPMFLLARKIKAMGVKMVMSGEGADETFAGYLYFHKAPNATELHEELVRKVADLHRYDCLRANKATMAHGLEARVPFLDKDMLDAAMFTDGEYKMVHKGEKTQHLEKWMLRAAFDDPDVALPARGGALAAEGAVQRRRGLLVDRRHQGARGEGDQRRRHGDGQGALPVQHADDQGGLLLPHHLPLALPQQQLRQRHRGDGAGRPVDRVLDGEGDRVGRGVGGQLAVSSTTRRPREQHAAVWSTSTAASAAWAGRRGGAGRPRSGRRETEEVRGGPGAVPEAVPRRAAGVVAAAAAWGRGPGEAREDARAWAGSAGMGAGRGPARGGYDVVCMLSRGRCRATALGRAMRGTAAMRLRPRRACVVSGRCCRLCPASRARTTVVGECARARRARGDRSAERTSALRMRVDRSFLDCSVFFVNFYTPLCAP